MVRLQIYRANGVGTFCEIVAAEEGQRPVPSPDYPFEVNGAESHQWSTRTQQIMQRRIQDKSAAIAVPMNINRQKTITTYYVLNATYIIYSTLISKPSSEYLKGGSDLNAKHLFS